MEGGFKFTLAGKQDCFSEGKQLWRTFLSFFEKYLSFSPEWRAQDDINIVSQMVGIIAIDLESRCNYFATFQALVLNKLIIDILYFEL